jgi:hypothetical protein
VKALNDFVYNAARVSALVVVAIVSGCGPDKGLDDGLISLSSAWGYGIPGTKDIRDLDPVSHGRYVETPEQQAEFENSLVQSILAELSRFGPDAPYRIGADELHRIDRDTPPLKAFVVEGVGRDALDEVYEILAGGQPVVDQFDVGTELSVVFFTAAIGASVSIESIEHRESEVVIEYRFQQHWADDSSVHLALIPMPPMPTGQGSIRVTRLLPDRFENRDASGDIPKQFEKLVSQSSKFSITP